MGIIDFCVIVIFSFAIVRGFSAGLAKQIFAFANWFLALTLAALFAGPFARYLNGTVLYSLLEEKTAAYLAARSPAFAAALDHADSGAQIGAALGELGLPGFIGDFIIRRAGVVAPSPEATLAQALAAPVAEAALYFVGFLFLFCFFILTVRLIAGVVDDVLSFGFLGWINSLGGALFSLAKAAIVVSLLMIALSVLAGLIPAVNAFLLRDLRAGAEALSPGRYFYFNNPLRRVFSSLFGA